MREMMTHLQKYQACQDSESKSNTTTGSQPKREPPKTNPWSKKTFREQRPAQTKADLDKITCFKCHKKGHYARECRQPEAFVVEEELRPSVQVSMYRNNQQRPGHRNEIGQWLY